MTSLTRRIVRGAKVRAARRLRMWYTMLRPGNLSFILRYRSRRPRKQRPSQSRETALKEAILWLCRSQEAGPDDGASCFRMATGWSSGYPEVTGYNLHTLLEYHELTGDGAAREHAVRMADWELTVQLENGAFQGGYVNEKAEPVVFNTAQVLQGLVKAYQVTGRQAYLDAASRAADWLVSVQDEDGAWRKHVYLGEFRVTDTRVAYPLLQMWEASGDHRYQRAAEKSLRYVISLQKENGWLPLCDNSVELADQPVTHTLAYTCEGLLKSGLMLQSDSLVAAAQKTADAMLRRFEADKVLYGRYNSTWQPTVRWACLTGCAQTSEIWSLLYLKTRDARYLNAALRMNDYLCACQDVTESHPGMRGAVSGAEPLGGEYQAFAFPSWATKYFCDALMAERKALEDSPPGAQSAHP